MRRERAAAYGLVVVLVLFRSLPFALYEQIQFDSDQAIFGLMAKHLSEGRAFPLFMYGNEYLLAVEAWLAAPWFLVAPPTLLTLSLSLILVNIATALLIVFALERWASLTPWQAFAAAVFFIVPPPIVAGDFVSVSGGNVEPFLYITALWLLRHRPFWSGAVLAVGFLQREFTVYAVPILLLSDLLARRLFTRARIAHWLIAAVTCIAVWEGIQALQPYADLMGPGTSGQLLRGFAGSQIGNLMSRVNVDRSTLSARAHDVVTVHMPHILGSDAFEARLRRPRPLMSWLLVVVMLAAAVRLVLLARSSKHAPFAWFVLGVGILATVMFALTHPVNHEYARYGLLALFIPVGLSGALLALEPHPLIRRLWVAAAIAWALITSLDTARLYTRYAGAPPSDYRILASALLGRDVRTASAPYWTAYVVTFMTGERVKIASTDFVRIEQYQRLAAENPSTVFISEQPCAGDHVARWYVCR